MPMTYVPVSIPDATTYTVLKNNTGVTHLVPDFTATCTATLPSPVAGLEFTFEYNGGAADAQNFVISTGSATNYFVGGVMHIDVDGNTTAAVYSDGNSNDTFTWVTPDVGTSVRIWSSDGVVWNVNGIVCSATVPTIAD